MESKLKQEEQRIDLKVLHHLNRDDHRKKLKRFRRTVSAVHAIVSNKLYRSKASSLEAYFREAWKISRAQVYRFLDCAWVLKHLEGFSSQPCRERLCRSLKRLAKNRNDIRKLWESVLDKVDNDHEAVTSTIIATIWAELLERGQVTGKPDPVGDEAAEILSDRDRPELDDDDSDSDPDPQNDAAAGTEGQGRAGDTQAADLTLAGVNKEAAPLTLEPALDRTSDLAATLLGSTLSQTSTNAYQSASGTTFQQTKSTFSDRTLPMPSTLTDVAAGNATGLSWRNTTLAPTSLDAGIPASLTRGLSLPMLRDLPHSTAPRSTWSNPNVPTTQSTNSLPNHMVMPQTRPLWNPGPVASTNTSTGTVPAPTNPPPVPGQHGEIPNTDVNTCADLLDSFSRKGYALQPYVHGRWVEEPASQWRIAPIDPRFRRIPLLYVPSMTTAPPSHALGNLLASTIDPAAVKGSPGIMPNGQALPSIQLQSTRPQDPHLQTPQYVYITTTSNPAFAIQQHPTPIYSATPAPPQYNPQFEYERLLALQGRYAGAQAAEINGGVRAGNGMFSIRTVPNGASTGPQTVDNREHGTPALPVIQASPIMAATGAHPWMTPGAAAPAAGPDHPRTYNAMPVHVPAPAQGANHSGGTPGYGTEVGTLPSAGTAW